MGITLLCYMAEILKDIQLLCIEKHVENKKEYDMLLTWNENFTTQKKNS